MPPATLEARIIDNSSRGDRAASYQTFQGPKTFDLNQSKPVVVKMQDMSPESQLCNRAVAPINLRSSLNPLEVHNIS
jgi:hypothetical protein